MATFNTELIIYEADRRIYYDATTGRDLSYSLVWLDPNVNQLTDLQARLREIIPSMETCETAEQYQSVNVKYSENYRSFVLIVASSISHSFIPVVHEMINVRKIFIYSPNDANYDFETLQRQFNKVKMVVYSPEELVEAISNDWEECEKPDPMFCYTILNSPDRTMSNRDSAKLWFKLLVQCLSHWSESTREADKQELIDLMKKEYRNNAYQRIKIDEFDRTYAAVDALTWYSKDFCLYRMVNKALRRGDASALFSFRLFIKDLYVQLEVLLEDQRQSRDRMLRTYRGQAMSRNELMNIQVNQLLCINTFFSTTLDQQQALSFIFGGVEDTNRLQPVLFQIDADRSIKSSIFADISSVSGMPDEQEVLFMPGTLFRVVSIAIDSAFDATIIRLELCNEDNLEVFDIFKSYEFDMLKQRSEVRCFEYAELLHELGEYRDAEKFFLRHLNDSATNSSETLLAYRGLAHVAVAMGKYDTAALYGEKVLDIVLGVARVNYVELSQACRLLCVTYCHLQKYELSIEFGEYALDIAKLMEDDNVRFRLLYGAYDALGMACTSFDKWKFASYFYGMTLKVALIIYPFNHPNIGMLYESLGALYLNMQNFKLSIEYSTRSLDIYKQTLPMTHSRIGDIAYNMAMAYGFLNDVDNFLTFASNACEIYQYNFPKTHPSVLRAQGLLHIFEELMRQKHGWPVGEKCMFFLGCNLPQRR